MHFPNPTKGKCNHHCSTFLLRQQLTGIFHQSARVESKNIWGISPLSVGLLSEISHLQTATPCYQQTTRWKIHECVSTNTNKNSILFICCLNLLSSEVKVTVEYALLANALERRGILLLKMLIEDGESHHSWATMFSSFSWLVPCQFGYAVCCLTPPLLSFLRN